MVFVDEHRAIVLATAPTLHRRRRRVLVPNTTYVDLSPSAFGVSPDQKFVFLAHEAFKVRNTACTAAHLSNMSCDSLFVVAQLWDGLGFSN